MGLDYDNQLIMSGVLNVTQLVGVITSIWSMDRIGRRPLLVWGSFFMAISHIIIAILVGKFDSNWPAHRTQGWVSVAFLLFYMLSFGASWGPVPWAMPSGKFYIYTDASWTFELTASLSPLIRNLPFLPPRKRRRSINLLKLVQQLHHRKFHLHTHH